MPAPPADSRQEVLRARLREIGFDAVQFASVDGATRAEAGVPRNPLGWVAAGMHAEMQWMERSVEKRLNPDLVLPGVRSVIVLGVSYWNERNRAAASTAQARWARYALYEDYHDTMKPGLVAAGRVLEELYGVAETDYRYYVDTGPVIDRAWAARAGLGFVGKNAMLISQQHGNWLFLAAILTRLDFSADRPIRQRPVDAPVTAAATAAARPTAGGKVGAPGLEGVMAGDTAPPPVGGLCGKCTRCLDVCPTDAFSEPGVVDARRCISYHTIENKGVIPRELRAGIGERIYGCDACLEVCPWNRFARESRRLLLVARDDVAALSLAEMLALTPERFAELFRRTPIKRLKLAGLLRNACIVAGNRGDRSLLPLLVALAESHPLPLVRAHAVWAVFRLGGSAQLATARLHEADPLVIAEYDAG